MVLESKILSKEIQQILYTQGKKLATAESCTGGRVAEAIISVPGASDYFKGSIIAYADEIKEALLHVSPDTLAAHTACSEAVAVEMVKGVCAAMNTDFGLAVTGVAGPAGGTSENPVGTIWLAYGTPSDVKTCKLTEDHGRDVNLLIATNTILHLFLDYLKTVFPLTPSTEIEKNP